MTQQIFYVEKTIGDENLYARSVYGSNPLVEAVSILPDTELEFLIYHGPDGNPISIGVGAWPSKTFGYIMKTPARPTSKATAVTLPDVSNKSISRPKVRAITPKKIINPTNATKIKKPTSLDNQNPWHGNNWGPGEFFDDGYPENPNPDYDPPFPGGGGSGGGGFRQAALEVRLYRPNEEEPIYTWQLEALEHSDLYRPLNFPITLVDGVSVLPPQGLMEKHGWWKCILVLKGTEPAYIHFSSKSFLKKVTTKVHSFNKRWLNHAFWNVLSAIAPQVSIAGNTIGVQLAKELSDATGREPKNYTYSNSHINSHIELTSINIDATRGKDLHLFLKEKRDLALQEWRAAQALYKPGEPAMMRQLRINLSKSNYSKAKARYEFSLVNTETDDAVIRFTPVFSNPSVDISVSILEGTIEFEAMPSIFISFGKKLSRGVKAYSEVGYKITNLNFVEQLAIDFLDVVIDIYNFFSGNDQSTIKETLDSINSEIEKVIEDNSDMVAEYLYMALSKAAGSSAVMEGLKATATGWEITYYDEVEHPDPSKPIIKSNNQTTHLPETGGTKTKNRLANAKQASFVSDSSNAHPTANAPYSDFKLGSPTSLRKLDQVEMLVIIMMENRSFDHFLGDLKRTYPGKDYDCFDPEFTNPPAGNFVNPIPVCKASDVFHPNANITPVSPEHAYGHVMRQISDGKYDINKLKSENDMTKVGLMQGFTLDIMARYSEEGGNIKFPHKKPRFESPQMVMSYYTKEQLPTYYHLAENFKILDKWFAAHPGATWPNRIATHTGKLISTQNFPLDDKRLGYLKERTVYDVLSAYGIDWKFMESNISIMRLFDRYRADDNHVIPLHRSQYVSSNKFNINDDDFAELDNLLAGDKLPRVLVIEPRFSDVPPLKKAYDDLAPADISSGQAFIQQVYEKLLNSRHWDKTTMLITYDEHGGFFDHVPPPGTQHSEFPDPVPPIYVDPKEPDNQEKWGPTHLGVRVPAILVSPFVNPHSVSHIVFDHTSILKTILVHNRKKIPNPILASFGARVNQANHLGMAMDIDQTMPRPKNQLLKDLRNLKRKTKANNLSKRRSGINNYYKRHADIDPQDYHESLRKLYMPK